MPVMLACYLDRFHVCMFKSAVWECKMVTWGFKPCLNDCPAIAYLVFQFLCVVIVYAIVVKGMRTNGEAAFLQIAYLAPCHGMFSWGFCRVDGEILYIVPVVILCSVNQVWIYEEHGINTKFLKLGGNLCETIPPAVIEGECHSGT